MTDRAMFLTRLRARMQRGVPENLPHPLVVVDEVPRVGYARDLSDPVATFVEKSISLGVTARLLSSREDLEAFIADVVSEHNPQTVVLSRDPEAAAVRTLIEGHQITITEFDSAAATANVDVGIVGGAFGIAATGTVVLDSSRAGGRTASLLPPVMVCLVDSSSIFSEAGELFRHMHDHFPDGPPSQLVFVSGPSRSADIELTLTIGVHGPGRVWVGVVQQEGK